MPSERFSNEPEVGSRLSRLVPTVSASRQVGIVLERLKPAEAVNPDFFAARHSRPTWFKSGQNRRHTALSVIHGCRTTAHDTG